VTDTVDEKLYAELREVAARYPEARSGLLPMLHLVQSAHGRVTSAGIEACADILGISAADVSGVAMPSSPVSRTTSTSATTRRPRTARSPSSTSSATPRATTPR
jgi:NADH:ubiquinone oxidoreductase subunit E